MYRNILTLLFLIFMGFGAMAQNKAPQAGNDATECPIRMPNAFTPNDDGVNDFFYFTFLQDCVPTQFSLQIFDRWGRLVFETKEYTDKWDGRFDGQEVKEGAFFWVMSTDIRAVDQEEVTTYTKKGSVLIVR